MHFVAQKINFNKNEADLKMENPTRIFKETNLHFFITFKTCFSSYNKCKLKVKLWWVGDLEGKKENTFCTFVFSEGNFLRFVFYLSVESIWIHFQNLHTFTKFRHYFIRFYCLFLKLSKPFSVSLREHAMQIINFKEKKWSY